MKDNAKKCAGYVTEFHPRKEAQDIEHMKTAKIKYPEMYKTAIETKVGDSKMNSIGKAVMKKITKKKRRSFEKKVIERNILLNF